MAWTRASSIDRTLQCLGSQWVENNFPEVRNVSRSEGLISAGDWGTMVHWWKETGKVDGSISHMKTFQKKLDFLEKEGVTRETLWPADGFHEISVAFNCEDRRVAISWEGEGNDWKAGYSHPWITGTLDYVKLENGVEGATLVVDDLKTGASFDKTPAELAQTYFYLMCLEKVFHTNRDCISSITHWTKYPVEGLPNRMTDVFPIELLHRFEERLVSDYKKYQSITAPIDKSLFKLGNECQFCNVKKANLCPISEGYQGE